MTPSRPLTLISFVNCFAVKLVNHFRRKQEAEPPAAPPPRQEKLLEEIRDLLKQKTIS